MKKTTTILGLTALLSAFTAQAENVKLEDNSKILGKWHVFATAPALHKEKRAQDALWIFKKNGTLSIQGKDVVSGRTGMMDISLKYSVENGGIKRQTAPGRERYENCAVTELDDKKMTLKCTFLYYFLTKK